MMSKRIRQFRFYGLIKEENGTEVEGVGVAGDACVSMEEDAQQDPQLSAD